MWGENIFQVLRKGILKKPYFHQRNQILCVILFIAFMLYLNYIFSSVLFSFPLFCAEFWKKKFFFIQTFIAV